MTFTDFDIPESCAFHSMTVAKKINMASKVVVGGQFVFKCTTFSNFDVIVVIKYLLSYDQSSLYFTVDHYILCCLRNDFSVDRSLDTANVCEQID